MPTSLESRLRNAMPAGVDFASVRYLRQEDEVVSVRQDVPQPLARGVEAGAMITVVIGGALGYAATCDLSDSGLKDAARRALKWAKLSAGRAVTDFSKIPWPQESGRYVGPEEKPWAALSLDAKFDLMTAESKRLKVDPRVVDWQVSLWHTALDSLYLTSGGGAIEQRFHFLAPDLRVTANEGDQTQTRSLEARAACRQGGLEVIDQVGLHLHGPRVAREAVELLSADNCPTGEMDLILAPDQMVLQVHESIGHPLELDRILGDERNYAGTSFVTMDMLGTYRYGSELLNITFDPTRPGQLASYGWDDEGRRAEKTFIIRRGVLERPLGGTVSQARAGKCGVANARASGWNRPPIDRMANINLEPGESTLESMIAQTARGVYMQTNCSWSIDDSRNKFQFGCEWGRLIENGKLTKLVKNCNYRGISATFWRSLAGVGSAAEVGVMGTPNCGKGEPNQMARVAHACPPARFAGVQVFGGA
ncbi:MAG: TldD/PmbA family protein [Planctomycetota bacterium]|nr:TldD/PmbA family protein [Planctomycetota bacterium]